MYLESLRGLSQACLCFFYISRFCMFQPDYMYDTSLYYMLQIIVSCLSRLLRAALNSGVESDRTLRADTYYFRVIIALGGKETNTNTWNSFIKAERQIITKIEKHNFSIKTKLAHFTTRRVWLLFRFSTIKELSSFHCSKLTFVTFSADADSLPH